MAWELKDEWIDLPRGRHYVVFHNRDVMVPAYDGSQKQIPSEHHLVHDFSLPVCPHCGVPQQDAQGEPIDFETVKAETLTKLQAHHKQVMRIREKSPRTRLDVRLKK